MTQTQLAPLTSSLDPAAVLAEVPQDLFLAGKWTPATGGRRMPVINPATGTELTEVADADENDARVAVEAARLAQRSWGRTPARVRSEILYRAYDLMVERTEHLAHVMTLEMGKTLAEARGEVAYAAEFFRWFAEEAVRVDGGYSHRPDGAARNLQVRQPVGPCLLIIPWNFPLAMGARKIGPAIAAGCVSILKPAPQTPLSSLALAQILTEAGLPEGVLSVLPTSQSAEVVKAILDSGVIRKLSFTGSTAVGKHLLAQAAEGVLRTSMELGGNAPFLVLEDADLDRAVEAAFQAKMRNMGEACTAANRFFVHAAVAEEFSSRLAERMGALVVGDGTAGRGRCRTADRRGQPAEGSYVDRRCRRPRRIGAGGWRQPGSAGLLRPPDGAAQHPPRQRADLHRDLRPGRRDPDVHRPRRRDRPGERHRVGPGGLRHDPGHRQRASTSPSDWRSGMVGINSGVVSSPSAPFGGVKQSGLGREGGRVGIDEFLEIKYISIPVRS